MNAAEEVEAAQSFARDPIKEAVEAEVQSLRDACPAHPLRRISAPTPQSSAHQKRTRAASAGRNCQAAAPRPDLDRHRAPRELEGWRESDPGDSCGPKDRQAKSPAKMMKKDEQMERMDDNELEPLIGGR